ncbi:hypothetical protein PENSTE_c002G02270 [Penicillium steckii]|uniref:DUF1993 domain-containing protein n=1 Tax=Penicillium steckii TaxID=303698 RepID=A0A1V6TU05_9EURO|nr:hypothetical protein PENSTE_c002G02270 [Penicillium steckii]
MSYTIYESFVLQTKRALTSLSNIIQKAENSPNASTLPSARLHPEMKCLSYQVFAATTQTSYVLAVLTDKPIPEINTKEDVLYTYAELHSRINDTLQAIESVDKDTVVENGDKTRSVPLGEDKPLLSGIAYASIMQANIFFHVTTAYGILRKEDVSLGKIDYILPFAMM